MSVDEAFLYVTSREWIGGRYDSAKALSLQRWRDSVRGAMATGSQSLCAMILSAGQRKPCMQCLWQCQR